MGKINSTSKIIGILYLTSLFTNVIATEILNPIVESNNVSRAIEEYSDAFMIGNLFNLLSAITLIFIPIQFYSITKKFAKNAAISLIILRLIEGLIFCYIVLETLSIMSVNQSTDPILTNFLIQLKLSNIELNNWVYILLFCSGALLNYLLLFKYKLLPSWLTIWGIIAVITLFVGDILGGFHLSIFSNTPLMKGIVYFAWPIALNELVLGFYLIVNGLKET